MVHLLKIALRKQKLKIFNIMRIIWNILTLKRLKKEMHINQRLCLSCTQLEKSVIFRIGCFENPIEIFDYVQAKSKELIRKNDILCVILNKALKEALGERGTPGNAEYIIYVAEKLIEVYKSDHLWALDFKCISVPEMFEKLIEYTSELSKSIIEDIENFIDDYDKRINELSYGLEDISGEKVVSFNLELRSPDMNKIDAEIKRLEEILLNN